MKTCENCGIGFAPKRVDARVCGPDCGKELHNSAYSYHKTALGICGYRGCDEPKRESCVYCIGHAAIANERRKKYTLNYKLKCLDAYGGRVCFGCGEVELCVLSLDHIEGGGSRHRQQEKVRSGTPFYQWLIRNHFPAGYRVLCMNCQFRARAGEPFPNER